MVERKKLEELGFSFVSGQIISRVITQSDDVEKEKKDTIVAKTISDGYIDDKNVVKNSYKVKCDEKRLTKKGDIVIKSTLPFAAAVVDENHEGLLVSSFCILLSKKGDNISSDYINAWLNSFFIKNWAEERVSNTTIQSLNISVLKDLDVPIVSIENQEKISKIYKRHIENIKMTNRLLELDKELLNSTIMESII